MQRKVRVFTLVGLFVIVVLSACNPRPSGGAFKEPVAIFDAEAIAKAEVTVLSSELEVVGLELANEEVNVEGAVAPVEDSGDLSSQAILEDASGYLAYFRSNASGVYEIWVADQATDVKLKVFSSPNAVQSVAVDGSGKLVVASVVNAANGNFDVYLFDLNTKKVFNLTATHNKDELDVSMTADASVVVYSKPTNAGLSKIHMCHFDLQANSCAVTVLGSRDNQRQASISSNGRFIALVRDVELNSRWRILVYDVQNSTYRIVVSRYAELSHPSTTMDGQHVMYIRALSGKRSIRVKHLATNVIDSVLSTPNLDHPQIMRNLDFFAYQDATSNGSRAFTRNLSTNERASSHAGAWDYHQPYWQQSNTARMTFQLSLTGVTVSDSSGAGVDVVIDGLPVEGVKVDVRP